MFIMTICKKNCEIMLKDEEQISILTHGKRQNFEWGDPFLM